METRGRAIGTAAPEWLRGPARLDDGFVVLDIERATPYQPQAEPDLLFALAGIRRPTDALPFVKDYGLLRHGPDADSYREPFSDWERIALELSGYMSAYDDIRRAALGDAEALERLRILVEDGVSDALAELLESMEGGTADERLIETVNLFVAVGITNGLRGVEVGLTPATAWGAGPVGSLVFSPQPPDLVGLAYHQLALLTVSQAPMSRCPECGRIFAPRGKKQRFCSPLCSGRSRQRRYAEKET